jgi:hypothetical protein
VLLELDTNKAECGYEEAEYGNDNIQLTEIQVNGHDGELVVGLEAWAFRGS